MNQGPTALPLRTVESYPRSFYPLRRDAAEIQPLKRLMTKMLVDAVQCFQAGERQRIETKEVSEARP